MDSQNVVCAFSGRLFSLKKVGFGGFSGGSMVKNQPANADDAGSVPGPRRSHMQQRY